MQCWQAFLFYCRSVQEKSPLSDKEPDMINNQNNTDRLRAKPVSIAILNDKYQESFLFDVIVIVHLCQGRFIDVNMYIIACMSNKGATPWWSQKYRQFVRNYIIGNTGNNRNLHGVIITCTLKGKLWLLHYSSTRPGNIECRTWVLELVINHDKTRC